MGATLYYKKNTCWFYGITNTHYLINYSCFIIYFLIIQPWMGSPRLSSLEQGTLKMTCINS